MCERVDPICQTEADRAPKRSIHSARDAGWLEWVAYVGASSSCPCPTSSDQTSDAEPAASTPRELEHLLTRVQDGVVSRRSCVSSAPGPRHRPGWSLATWCAVHPGVYVATPGTHVGAASLGGGACLLASGAEPPVRVAQPPSAGLIHVAIDHRRSVRRPRASWCTGWPTSTQRTNWLRSPPRVRLEHAAIDVCSGQDVVADRFRVLAMPARPGRPRRPPSPTLGHPPSSAGPLSPRGTAARSRTGACSVLEREYLELERVHGCRTRTAASRIAWPDAPSYRTRRTTTSVSRSSSTGGPSTTTLQLGTERPTRDLDTVVADDSITVRLTHGQVFDRGARPSPRSRRCWGAGAGLDRSSGAPTALDARLHLPGGRKSRASA